MPASIALVFTAIFILMGFGTLIWRMLGFEGLSLSGLAKTSAFLTVVAFAAFSYWIGIL